MTDPREFFLTEAELRERFEQYVRPFVFSAYKPEAEPVLVLLGGQPGAGKSQAMAAIQHRHAGRQLVPLTGDELRPWHPRYTEMQRIDARTLETGTAQASGAWVRMSIDHALRNRHGLILEGVFRDPEMTVGTGERFAGQGVRVEMVALAVREERSRLDAVHRYLDGGRWTPPELQDLAYRKLPETVAAAQDSPHFSRIVITNRTGADLFVNERSADGSWAREPLAVEAVEAEQSRPLPPEEARQWLDRYRAVVVEMAARGEINAESRSVMRQLTHDADVIAPMANADPNSEVRQLHEARQPMLRALATEPVPPGPLPVQLRPGSELGQSPAEGAERQRRDRLTAPQRSEEDKIRSEFQAARGRLSPDGHQVPDGSTTVGQAPDRQATEAARIADPGIPPGAAQEVSQDGARTGRSAQAQRTQESPTLDR